MSDCMTSFGVIKLRVTLCGPVWPLLVNFLQLEVLVHMLLAALRWPTKENLVLNAGSVLNTPLYSEIY